MEIAERPDPVIQEGSGVRATGDSSPAALEFRSVSFAYNKRPALREVTFRVECGETVALVGLNGSGKSTIGLLATGLYDPAAGTILVGGCDIRAMAKRNLRSLITLLPQEPILFDRTIRDNLLFGNPRASPRDLDMVAALTQFDCVLRRLPCGLDEPLGPVGAKLSGGERKRLALARTLLQDPKILIVDEFTNSLDAPSAALILAGLDQFRHGRTLVVISHRPSAILWADRIVVLDEGRIVDSGQHADLIGRCEAYQRIWEFQEGPIANSEWIASRKAPSNGEVRTGFTKESMHWQ